MGGGREILEMHEPVGMKPPQALPLRPAAAAAAAGTDTGITECPPLSPDSTESVTEPPLKELTLNFGCPSGFVDATNFLSCD